MMSSVSRPFPAKYGGQECDVCGNEIYIDEMVCFYGEDLVHEECADDQKLKYEVEDTKEWTPKWRR